MRLAVVLGAVLLAAAAARADVKWEKDFEEARVRAVEEGKLIFLDFYAEW